MKHFGQIVGYTRSGRTIFGFLPGGPAEFPHPEHVEFSASDHFDAYVVFELLVLRAKRKHGEGSSEHDMYGWHLQFHRNSFTSKSSFEEEKLRAGCRDAFDSSRLGRSLVRPEFQDL